MTSRRTLIKTLLAAPLVSLSPHLLSTSNDAKLIQSRHLKTIPKTGEQLAAIGMGSYQTFDVASDSAQLSNLKEVIHHFFAGGGQLIDSSPMYGNSESILGKLLSQTSNKSELFAASKVWTYGKKQGMLAVKETQRRMQVEKMDLMQVHNLRDWKLHLPTLHDLKARGKLRYVGITTSFNGQFDDFEALMRSQELDFIQINYNIADTESAEKILPLAKDKGVAVIINKPFEKGLLFNQVKGKNLPEWAKEIDCHSWAQFFLKYIISHSAVTCAIPATSKIKHMKDNMMAMQGRLPNKQQRIKMKSVFDAL
jgi:diketogulonate reductase-like aldo/keto reductase